MKEKPKKKKLDQGKRMFLYMQRNRKAQGIALPGLFVLRLQYWCFLFA